MTYEANSLKEYPLQIDDGLTEGDDETELTFLYRECDEGVIPPPTPASFHVDEWVENIQYNSRVNVHKRNLANDESVRDAQELGYIIPLAGEIGFSRKDLSDSAPEWAVGPTYSYMDDDYLRPASKPPETGLKHSTFVVNTRWAIDVPDGYSVLVTTPFFMKPDTYSVVPYVIDADVGLHWIEVTMLLHESEVRIRFGSPIVQVIPFKRESAKLPAVVDRTPPSER